MKWKKTFIVFILMMAVLPLMSNLIEDDLVKADPLGVFNYVEDFEGQSDGEDPSDTWYTFTKDLTSDEVEIDENNGYEGSDGLHSNIQTNQGWGNFTLNTPISGDICWAFCNFTWGIKMTNMAQVKDKTTIRSSDGVKIVSIWHQNQDIYVNGVDTGINVIGGNPVPPTWYNISIAFNFTQNTLQLSCDGDTSSWISFTNNSADSIGQFIIEYDASMYLNVCYYDNLSFAAKTYEGQTGPCFPHSDGKCIDNWVNPENAYASDDTYAQAYSFNSHSREDFYNFSLDVPPAVSITGIEVAVEGYADSNSAAQLQVRLAYEGCGNYTDYKTELWPETSESIKTFGSSTDSWGRKWLTEDFETNNFHVYCYWESGADPYDKLYVDAITVNVFYAEFPVNTTVLVPVGNGSKAEWIATGETYNWECVDEYPINFTSAVVTGSDAEDSYELENYTLPAGTDTIAALTVNTAHYSNPLSSQGLLYLTLYNGTTYDTVLVADLPSQYDRTQIPGNNGQNYSHTWTLNPFTGTPWTAEAINATEIGVAFDEISATFVYEWSVWAEVYSFNNTAPQISNEYPTDGNSAPWEIYQNSLKNYKIDVADTDGHTMNISIRSNTTGSWETKENWAAGGNGTYETPIDCYTAGRTYWWSVNVTDGWDWTNATYSYETYPLEDYYEVTSLAPANGSTGVNWTPTLSATIHNNYSGWTGNTLYSFIWLNETGSWMLGNSKNVSNQADFTITDDLSGLQAATTYWWRMSVFNTTPPPSGESLWRNAYNQTYSFTTAPVEDMFDIYDPQPANGSTNVSLNPTLSFNATNNYTADGWVGAIIWTNETGSWTIKKVTNMKGVASDTCSYTFSDLSLNTTYWWKASLTGGYNWLNETYSFTTAPVEDMFDIYDPQPANGSTNVSLNPSGRVRFTENLSGDATAYVRTNQSGSWLNIWSGSVSATHQVDWTFLNLDINTTYFWSANITDGHGNWLNETYHFTTKDLWMNITLKNAFNDTLSSWNVSSSQTIGPDCFDTNKMNTTHYWFSVVTDNEIYKNISAGPGIILAYTDEGWKLDDFAAVNDWTLSANYRDTGFVVFYTSSEYSFSITIKLQHNITYAYDTISFFNYSTYEGVNYAASPMVNRSYYIGSYAETIPAATYGLNSTVLILLSYYNASTGSFNYTSILRAPASTPGDTYDNSSLENNNGRGSFYPPSYYMSDGERVYINHSYVDYNPVSGVLYHESIVNLSSPFNYILDTDAPTWDSVTISPDIGLNTSSNVTITITGVNDTTPENITINITASDGSTAENSSVTTETNVSLNVTAAAGTNWYNISFTDEWGHTSYYNFTYDALVYNFVCVDGNTGDYFDIDNITGLTVSAPEIGWSMDLKALGITNFSYFANASYPGTIYPHALRFELTYVNQTITRYFDMTVPENFSTPIRISIPESQTFYEQVIISNRERPFSIWSLDANAWILCDHTRMVGGATSPYMQYAYTIDGLYYIRIYDENGVPTTLATLDGGKAKTIALNQLEYEVSQNPPTNGSGLGVQKLSNQSLLIHYYFPKGTNTVASITLVNETGYVFLNHTETTSPNNFYIYYDWSTVSPGPNTTELLTLTGTGDGNAPSVIEFYLDTLTTVFTGDDAVDGMIALIMIVGLLILGLTLFASHTTFTYFGPIVIVIGLAISVFAEQTWYIYLLQFIMIIFLIFMVLIFRYKYSGVQYEGGI